MRRFTLQYWLDDGWLVGRLKEVPGVFSQGETIEALKENIKDAYDLMLAEDDVQPLETTRISELELEV